MFNIIHNDWIIKADFIIRKNEPYRIAEFERRRTVQVDDVTLFVVAPEDLILSKLVWSRDSRSELQLRDVGNLLQYGDDPIALRRRIFMRLYGQDFPPQKIEEFLAVSRASGRRP